jgi:rare lipoprotein A
MRKWITIILIILFFAGLSRFHEKASALSAPTAIFVREGQASWYSRGDKGINVRTASNEVFDDQAMTCAMWGVAFDRRVKVTNMDNGRSVILRVNDRGPHERFIRQGRIIDITKGAFSRLSPTEKGLINVRIEFL